MTPLAETGHPILRIILILRIVAKQNDSNRVDDYYYIRDVEFRVVFCYLSCRPTTRYWTYFAVFNNKSLTYKLLAVHVWRDALFFSLSTIDTYHLKSGWIIIFALDPAVVILMWAWVRCWISMYFKISPFYEGCPYPFVWKSNCQQKCQ